MSSNKYGEYEISNIVFCDKATEEKFMKRFRETYARNIPSSFFGRLFPGDKKEDYDKLTINIRSRHNKEGIKEYIFKGRGLRTWIWELEREISEAYNANQIVCYNFWNNTSPMVDDSVCEKEAKEAEEKFRADCQNRYQAFLNGTFELQDSKGEKGDWRQSLKDGALARRNRLTDEAKPKGTHDLNDEISL